MIRVFVCLAAFVAVQAATMTPMMTTTAAHKTHSTHAHRTTNMHHSTHAHKTHTTNAHHSTNMHHSHGTHATAEPSEHDLVRFVYEGHSHLMIMMAQKMCYIHTLTDTERSAVHTDVGIRTLELKLLNLLSSGTKTEVMIADQPKAIKNICGHALHIYTIM